jgi:hypothetical protein
MGIRGVLGRARAPSSSSNLKSRSARCSTADGRANLLHMPAAREVLAVSAGAPFRRLGVGLAGGAVEDCEVDKAFKSRSSVATHSRPAVSRRGTFDGLDRPVVVIDGAEFQDLYLLGRLPQGDGQFRTGTPDRPRERTSLFERIRSNRAFPMRRLALALSADSDTPSSADMNGDGHSGHRWPAFAATSATGRPWSTGVWGTGRRDDCPANSFADDRELAMADSRATPTSTVFAPSRRQ